MVLCSSTHLEDVPAADTFSVEDVCIVRTAGADKVTVSISFEVKFVKSTMLKVSYPFFSNSLSPSHTHI